MQKNLFGKKLRDLEPAIWSLAQEAKLGELRHVYHAAQYTSNTIISAIALLAFGIFFAIYPIIAISIGILSATWPGLLWFAPGLLLIAIGVALFLPRRIYAHWHVYLWEHGFIYEKSALRQVFRWDQIEFIQGSTASNPQSSSPSFSYKVRRQDGYEVKLNNTFSDIAQLMDNVLDGFSRYATTRELVLVPPRDKVFAQNFKLDLQGLSDKQGTEISWQEVQELTIEKGTMAVLKRKAVLSDHEVEHG